MLLRRLLVALALSLFSPAALSPAAMADPADIAAAGRGVVRVVIVENQGNQVRLVSHGSGFAIAPDLVVTNAHVVEELQRNGGLLAGIVPSQGQKTYPAHIRAFSPNNDLALLQVDNGANLPALTLFPGQAGDGEQVAALGFPGNVDMAQGLSLADVVTPQEAVKSYGNISAGRSSRQFDTILHTAQIGAGNSGGPLLDACGRVLGVNSFGTVTDNGTDSAFYFAISMREVTAFLLQAGVNPHTNGLPCTSFADLQRADSERAASDQARQAAEQQARLAAHQQKAEKAHREAELAILSERDNELAVAALLLVAALGAGGFALLQAQRNQTRKMKWAAGGAGAALLLAILVWVLRPPLSDIDEHAKDILADADAAAASASASEGADDQPDSAANPSAKLVCVLDPQRSRVTVSDITDVPFNWQDSGCVNARTQYGLAEDGWSRVFIPKNNDTISVNHFDPATHQYTIDRYLPDLDRVNQARAMQDQIPSPSCAAGVDAARQLGAAQARIRALLPPEPNERLRYTCQPRP
ncbi:trypsin-like peptidase domain-containing protein [Novosphingobium sp.]|uniref:trypsin-like peptidase domain-containing protein n=1 Tax=Novosphingobium sp. TaxID=1874826 RepID=UPI0038BB3D82